jgi:hypothetical protein
MCLRKSKLVTWKTELGDQLCKANSAFQTSVGVEIAWDLVLKRISTQ